VLFFFFLLWNLWGFLLLQLFCFLFLSHFTIAWAYDVERQISFFGIKQEKYMFAFFISKPLACKLHSNEFASKYMSADPVRMRLQTRLSKVKDTISVIWGITTCPQPKNSLQNVENQSWILVFISLQFIHRRASFLYPR
jgi:hypothetical protein